MTKEDFLTGKPFTWTDSFGTVRKGIYDADLNDLSITRLVERSDSWFLKPDWIEENKVVCDVLISDVFFKGSITFSECVVIEDFEKKPSY